MEKLFNYSFKTSHSHKKQAPCNHRAKPSQAETGPGALTCELEVQVHHRVRHLGFSPTTFSQGGATQQTCLFCHLNFSLPWLGTQLLHPVPGRILIDLSYCVGSTLHRNISSSSLGSIQDSQHLEKGNLSLLRVHSEQQLKNTFFCCLVFFGCFETVFFCVVLAVL